MVFRSPFCLASFTAKSLTVYFSLIVMSLLSSKVRTCTRMGVNEKFSCVYIVL